MALPTEVITEGAKAGIESIKEAKTDQKALTIVNDILDFFHKCITSVKFWRGVGIALIAAAVVAIFLVATPDDNENISETAVEEPAEYEAEE